MVALLLNLITCYYLANCGMLILGVRYGEKMTRRTWVRQRLVNQGIKISHILSVALGFAHSCISESKGQSRDAIHPTSEIGSYISRENSL